MGISINYLYFQYLSCKFLQWYILYFPAKMALIIICVITYITKRDLVITLFPIMNSVARPKFIDIYIFGSQK